MKREELKAYDGINIYHALECTPYNDDELHLEECFNNNSEFEFYEKNEADSVMDAMEARIKELEAQCIKYQAELMNRDPALNPPPTTEEE